MATIELALLSEHLEENETAIVLSAVAEETSEELLLGTEEDTQVLDSTIDDDVFVDFRDRLDANDLDADIYLPWDFEEIIVVGELRIGSTLALQLVLDSLREDFFIDGDEDFEDDEEEVGVEDEDEIDDSYDSSLDEGSGLYEAGEHDGIEMKDEQLRHVWRMMHQAAKQSIQTSLPLVLS